MKKREISPYTYYNPPNYKDTECIMGIKILKKRNIVETLIIVFIIRNIIKAIPFTPVFDIIFSCIFIVPFGALFFFGLSGQSVTQYLFSILKFKKQRKVVYLSMPGEETRTNTPNNNISDSKYTSDGMLQKSKAQEIMDKLRKK